MVLELDGLLVLNMFFVLYSLQIHSMFISTFFLSCSKGLKSQKLHYILLAVQFLVDF